MILRNRFGVSKCHTIRRRYVMQKTETFGILISKTSINLSIICDHQKLEYLISESLNVTGPILLTTLDVCYISRVFNFVNAFNIFLFFLEAFTERLMGYILEAKFDLFYWMY